jgi:hypothetical protein
MLLTANVSDVIDLIDSNAVTDSTTMNDPLVLSEDIIIPYNQILQEYELVTFYLNFIEKWRT